MVEAENMPGNFGGMTIAIQSGNVGAEDWI